LLLNLANVTLILVKAKHFQFGFVALLVLAIIGLGIIVVVSVAYFRLKQPTPQTQIMPTTTPKTTISSAKKDEAADWKTYISPNNTFSLKHPPNLNETKKYISLLRVGLIDEGVLSTVEPWNASLNDENDFNIQMSTGAKKTDESVEGFIERNIKEESGEFYSPNYTESTTKKQIVVDGKQGFWYEGALGPGLEHIEVFIPRNATEVTILALWDNNQPPSQKHQQVLNQILSTFKFLD
jgi:hypothetical protein